MILRHENWPTKLGEAIKTLANVPLQYGVQDCGMFVANLIFEMTGYDIAAPEFRDQYTTETGLAKIMINFADGTVEGTWAKLMERAGWEEIQPAYAGRGDSVLIPDEPASENLIVGIVDLSGMHVMVVGQDHIGMVPASAIQRAWRVG